MNISKIVDMIIADSKILVDVQKFLDQVNEKNIHIVTKTRDIIVEEETNISFAEQNGGIATIEDVEAAQKLLDAKPLKEEVEVRLLKLQAAIDSGEVKTTQEIIDKFSE